MEDVSLGGSNTGNWTLFLWKDWEKPSYQVWSTFQENVVFFLTILSLERLIL